MLIGTGVERLGAGCQNDSTDFQLMDLFPLGKINSTRLAGFLAGPTFPFFEIDTVLWINHILERDRLGILEISGLTFTQSLIELIVHLPWAFARTHTTGDALVHSYIAGTFSKGCPEMACFTFEGFNVCHGKQLNIGVPADLDQFGRKNSQGAIVGWESLIQGTHHAANGGILFHEVDEIP